MIGIMSKSESEMRKKSRSPKTPWALRGLRWVFAALNLLWPAAGARLAYRLWFTSPRFAEPARERRWRKTSHAWFLEHEFGPLAVYQWGQGPAVVLVHGWSGRGTQLGAFVEPLITRGFSVVAFDAPGHGRSGGTRTNAFEVAAALQAVTGNTGPAFAIIAHSFGTMATTLAIHQGMPVDKVVCISAPTSPLFLVEGFCQKFGMNRKTGQLFQQFLEKDFGADIWQRIASDHHVAKCRIPALIIHDKDDADVPWQWSEQLANAWSGSHFWLTQGLGHRRILRDPSVTQAVSEFIASGKLPENPAGAA